MANRRALHKKGEGKPAAWGPLNEALMRCRTSGEANRLLQRERDLHGGRPSYIRRIAARFRRLRTQEERREEIE